MEYIDQLKSAFKAASPLSLALVLLAGCSVLPPVKVSSISTYALEADFEHLAKETGDITLLVSMPNAQHGLDSTRMIYTKKAHEIDYFAQNKWVDSPARMLSPLLVKALESTNKFRAVVATRSMVTANLRLDTEIIRLQQEFLNSPSQIHITMRAQLIDIGAKRVLATRIFDVTEVAASDDPYGGVVAANRAIKNILLQIADFCVQESKSAIVM